MDCQLVIELLPNYLDDELTEELGQQVQAHLIGCRRCAWEVESLRQSVGALRESAQVARAGAEFRARLRKQLLRDHRAAAARRPGKAEHRAPAGGPVVVLDLDQEVGGDG